MISFVLCVLLINSAFSALSASSTTHSKEEIIWDWRQLQFNLANIENNKIAEVRVLQTVRDEKIRQLSEELKHAKDHSLEADKIAKKFAKAIKEYNLGENKLNESAAQASAKLQHDYIQKYGE
jgi:uncharacterized protein with von Willebrand factor type A (vWA) domain